MPGFILHDGASVQCLHGGQARSATGSARVTVGGQPVLVQPAPFVISACALTPQGGGPCATARFVTQATRVRVEGRPVLLADGASVCAPTGTGLVVARTQIRARAR